MENWYRAQDMGAQQGLPTPKNWKEGLAHHSLTSTIIVCCRNCKVGVPNPVGCRKKLKLKRQRGIYSQSNFESSLKDVDKKHYLTFVEARIRYLILLSLTTQTPEYQYHLKDHLGNVRLTFTTKEETETALATYETNNEQHEEEKFLRTENVRKVWSRLVDRTNGTSDGYAQRLSGGDNERFGLARSIAVMPGDKISAEVYAKYFDTSSQDPDISSLVAAIVAQLSGTNPSGPVVDGGSFETSTTSFPFAGEAGGLTQNDQTTGAPRAYLNWLVFDSDHVLIPQKSGFKRITTAAHDTDGNGSHERIFSPQITIDQPGYLYIYISNEEETQMEVFFDDFKVDHIKSPVVQMDDYYPFGLTFNSYSRENTVPNMYQYNGKEKQDELGLDWLDYGARMYNSDIGRWMATDNLSEKYYNWSPYVYCLNSPAKLIDPDGNVVRDPNGNIVARVRNRNATYTAGDAQAMVSFSATQVQILTNSGKSVNGYVANNSTVTATVFGENGVEQWPLEGTDNRYNCTGNVLADQKMTIASNEITNSTLKGEGFTPLGEGETPQAGDITAIKNGGIFTHFERYTSPTTVNSKGGVAPDIGNQPPGTSTFGQEKGATTTVMRKRVQDRVTNVVNSENSTTNNGITYVSNQVWRQIKKEQRQIRREERKSN